MLNAKEAQLQTENNIAKYHREQEEIISKFIESVNEKILKAIDIRQFTVSVDVPILSYHQENYINTYYQKLKYSIHLSGKKLDVFWGVDSNQSSII